MKAPVLSARWAPALFGLISALAFGWVWGSLDPVPTVHDEAAYVLQARIFAQGHWTAPPPLLPEFFEQIHVFVTPRVASKYPPGHSLVLVPGIWLGWPVLMPVLLGGLCGGLLFALARRVANPWTALVAWFFWATAPGDLRFHSTYLSETTTTALLLLSWWALLQWHEGGRARWLLVVAACMAWSALTRPFSTLALALPIGAVVARDVVARRRWRDLIVAGALAGGILLLIPLWSMATTGDWRTTPYALYSRIYFPYQRPGFDAPAAESLRPLPPDMKAYAAQFESLHRSHTIANLPGIMAGRLAALGRHMWGGWRRVFLIFAVAGLFSLSAESAFAVASALVLVVQYAFLAHAPGWTVYYLEIQPVLAFLTAAGLGLAASAAGARLRREQAVGSTRWRGFEAACALGVVLAGLVPAALNASRIRDVKRTEAAALERFRSLLRSLPERSVVFVRYGPDHDPHRSLIVNEPDLARARVWVVHDRGEDDTRLLGLAPDRVPYLYEESGRTLRPLPRGAPAPGPI